MGSAGLCHSFACRSFAGDVLGGSRFSAAIGTSAGNSRGLASLSAGADTSSVTSGTPGLGSSFSGFPILRSLSQNQPSDWPRSFIPFRGSKWESELRFSFLSRALASAFSALPGFRLGFRFGFLLGSRLGLLAAVEIGERGDGGARGVALPPADLLALVEHRRLLALADEAHQPILRHLAALLGQTVPVLPEGGIPLAPAIERGQRDAGPLGRELHFPTGAEVAQEEHPEPGRCAAGGTGTGGVGARAGSGRAASVGAAGAAGAAGRASTTLRVACMGLLPIPSTVGHDDRTNKEHQESSEVDLR